jgi:hypothetical protein
MGGRGRGFVVHRKRSPTRDGVCSGNRILECDLCRRANRWTLAWDVFFAFAVLFAAPVFSGNRLARSIRVLLIASGALSLAGLSGVVVGDMQLRMIGVVGYAGVFPIAALLLAILFYRAPPREAS